ncbi:MAG: hypothetical protein IKB82_01690 [Clostridia bacterium]|nr:hypothetical protein [Clostridia bacterium]
MKKRFCAFLAGMRRPRMGRRLAAMSVGVFFMGFCVAVFDLLGVGTDPCSVLNLGIARTLGIPFGTFQLMINIALLLLVIRLDAGYIGAGTLMNMTMVGYVAQLFMWLFSLVPALGSLSFAVRMAVFAPVMLLFLVAASVYMGVDMGVAPYDALPMILAARVRRVPFRVIRIFWDVAALSMGFMLGSTVGVATLITGFFLGPMITWISQKISPWFA